MSQRIGTWGLGSVVLALSAMACSSETLHELGEVIDAGDARAANSGASGLSDVAGGAGGGGGGSLPSTLECSICEPVVERSDVRGLATNQSKVFWVEYGTTDARGKHTGDGRLLSRDLSGGSTAVMAADLAGPDSLFLSEKYAYVFVDQKAADDALSTWAIVRVPLSGGASEIVGELPSYDTPNPCSFVAGHPYNYFVWENGLYRFDESPHPKIEAILPGSYEPRLDTIVGDDSTLYYADQNAVWSLPFDGSSAKQIGSLDSQNLRTVAGDYLYGLAPAAENGTWDLARLPKTGGSWEHVLPSPVGSGWQVALDGERFFFDQRYIKDDRPGQQLVQVSLSDPSTRTILARTTVEGVSLNFKNWSYTPSGIFLATTAGVHRLSPADH